MRTSGFLTQLPPDKLAKVLKGVGPVIDAMRGGITLSVATVAITARTGAA
jgi:hypothetical protein